MKDLRKMTQNIARRAFPDDYNRQWLIEAVEKDFLSIREDTIRECADLAAKYITGGSEYVREAHSAEIVKEILKLLERKIEK